MLRFIISRSRRDAVSGAEWQDFETVDIDVPALEARLGGGYGETGYDMPHLIGAEIRKPQDDPNYCAICDDVVKGMHTCRLTNAVSE